ncbi:MAG TPA: OmpA family protein [Stellaceae bacterium]|nr:OmpA family protein [Stellaceae bacterium]
MKFRVAAALALGLCLVGWGSQAQMLGPGPGTYGPYARLEGGWNHAEGTSFNGSTNGLGAPTPSSLAASSSWQEGYILGGAFGWGFGQYRAELNLDYRENRVSNLHVGSPGAIAPFPMGGASGSLNSITEMLNAYMDLPYSWMSITPYIGGGLGVAEVHYSSLSLGGTQIVSDTDLVPAIQAMAGLRYDFGNNWGLDLQYRFLNGFHPNIKDNAGNRASTSDYRNHSILLGISYSFGVPQAPPPMAAPAAAPAPAPAAAAGPKQLFIVFFDFDKSNLTAAGRQVLDEAAAAFRANQTVRIQVTGYTDSVGTQAYNLGLSQRRADSVRDYLATKGVPPARQNVSWKGKEDQRVTTPDGVREPQNRRVEIILP